MHIAVPFQGSVMLRQLCDAIAGGCPLWLAVCFGEGSAGHVSRCLTVSNFKERQQRLAHLRRGISQPGTSNFLLPFITPLLLPICHSLLKQNRVVGFAVCLTFADDLTFAAALV